jgi:hypothetical protein
VSFFPLGCISLNPASFVRHSYEQEEVVLLLFYSSDVVVMPSHNCHAKWGEKPNPCVKREEEVEKRASPEQ